METKRLILRRFTPEDGKDLYEYLSQEQVVKYEPYEVFTEEASKEEAVKRSVNEAFWAVCMKDTGKLIGNIYLSKQDFDTWELGYVFNQNYQGMGYATEAAEFLINDIFQNHNARRLIAMCNPLNKASWRLMERLGMRREGHLIQNIYFKKDESGEPIWSDTYEYAVLASEWRKETDNKNSMSVMNRTENVSHQYSNDKNLSDRIRLHAKHSTNKQGMVSWLFEKYRFSENTSILELGCGNAAQWEGRIEELPKGCTLTLSDFSEGMVNIVKDKFAPFKNVNSQEIDIQAIPFGKESFDVIIANHMLYHVPDLDKALSEVRRVLKKGGRFYSATNGNGGIRLFLYHVLKQFDSETEAFTQEYSFSLQNGDAILHRYFSSVKRLDYEDSLAITETQDLMDWMKSTASISNYSEDKYDELYEYFETIRKKDGSIKIPKESGLFISET